MKNYVSLVLCLFLSLSIKAQTSYYVDGANGNDTHTGTSPSTAWKTIQKSFNSATPGSTVYIKGGIYYETDTVHVSGSLSMPIVFTSLPGDTVYLDGTGATQPNLIYIQDLHDLVIQNITLRNMVQNYSTGIWINAGTNGGVSNITLKHLKITSINWTNNASATPTSNDNSNPLLISGGGSLQANAISKITIDSCEIYNNITGYSEALSFDGNIDSFTVSHNRVHDNTNIGICFEGNYGICPTPANDHARNGHCFLNVCYNNVSAYATSGGIYVDGGMNLVIERNQSYSNGYGIEIGCEKNGSTSNIYVRDNVFYHNQTAGIAMGGYTSATTGQVLNCSVTNNTFMFNNYSASGTGEMYLTKISNCIIENNIFYANSQSIFISRDSIFPFSGNIINYNDWYSTLADSSQFTVNWQNNTIASYGSYKSTTGFDAQSIYANPLLTDTSTAIPDFHLQMASPCINHGNPSYTAATGETDYYGSTRIVGGRVDMGCAEYAATTNIPVNSYAQSLLFYPNPFSEQATLSLPVYVGTATLKIYDIMGNLVRETNASSLKNIMIYRDGLAPGIYFLELISAQPSIQNKIKIIVQ